MPMREGQTVTQRGVSNSEGSEESEVLTLIQ